jgi:hypothetical protein
MQTRRSVSASCAGLHRDFSGWVIYRDHVLSDGLKGKFGTWLQIHSNVEETKPVSPRELSIEPDTAVVRAESSGNSDIAYPRTNQGWLYPAIVLDPFNREAAGRSWDSCARQL